MFEQTVKQAGYKMTRPRRVILDFLSESHHPGSAQEIHERVSGIDLVSVYRALALFEEIGIVQREDVAGTARYYLANSQHHHITCTKCGCSQCVPCRHQFKSIKGFKNINHQLTLTGLCSKCVK